MNEADQGRIDALIAALASAGTASDAFNQYALSCPRNATRRHNLRLYLRHMAECRPPALMVMEAPGYRGCRLTGLPVTSRALLLEGSPRLGILGSERGYRDVDDPGFERIYREQSATIVWAALEDIEMLPFIWNTFPFHPHRPGQALTNRKPRAAEIKQGMHFLRLVMAIWHFQLVIAVGNVAYDALSGESLDCVKLRHPAHGGKNDFVTGLRSLCAG